MPLCDLFLDQIVDDILCTTVVLGWDSYPGGSYLSYFHGLSSSCCRFDSFSNISTYFCCNALRTSTLRAFQFSQKYLPRLDCPHPQEKYVLAERAGRAPPARVSLTMFGAGGNL